ncbi:MAG: S9 family peptidase [Vicinamibacterales bacterium]
MLVITALGATGVVAQAQSSTRPATLSAKELTSVRSVVGGVTPQWAPDGSRLLIGGALGGSDLWTVPAAGGFPVSLEVEMGEIAFLQSHQPKYSPDGKWISYISNRSGPAELFVRSLVSGTEKQLTRLGGRINSYSWSPDGAAIAFAGDKFGNYDVWTVAVATGDVIRLTNDSRYDVFPSWTPDGRQVVYARMDDRWLDHEVLEVDARGATPPRLIVKDTGFFDYQAGGNFGYSLVSPDGSTLLFRSHRSGWINYWVVPMNGGTPRQIAAEAANQSGARWSPDGKSIAYVALWNGMQDLRIVDAAGGTSRIVFKPADMGFVSNAEWSPDGSQMSFTMETPVRPAELYVVAKAGGAPRQLTSSTGPSYVTDALIRPRKVSYKSPDGLTIQAYLYEPILKAGEKAPGILYIHGGPTSSFNDTYQAQVQYFAMRGYAVLLPNIRGSSGYGQRFEDANNGCWGRCDLQDVTAGVEFLRTLPNVEPTRMGITGTSYGGCMSLAAAAFAPGVFQAAIAASGYGDWLHFHAEQELRHVKLVEYEFGPLPKAEAVYRKASPIFYMKDIQTPIMLIHGVGAQLPRSVASQIFADRLEMNYKSFVYKTYPNENYYIRRRDNIQTMLGDMLAYFDQHLKDGVREPAVRAALRGGGQ